ncbi:MAG: hypothetical protein ACTSRK_11860 [Promethearchaeota archaeon]
MKTSFLAPSIYGIMALNEQNELIDFVFQDHSISDLSKLYFEISSGNCPEDFQAMLNRLNKNGTTNFQVENPNLKKIILETLPIKVEIVTDDKRLREVYENTRVYFRERGLIYSSESILERTKILAEFLTKAQISEKATQKDYLIKQAVDTIVEMDKAINFFSTRVREWYGLHFPELTDKLIDDNVKFAKFVAKIGLRENFSQSQLSTQLQLSESITEDLILKAERSMGGKLSPLEFLPIKQLANQIIVMADYRKNLEIYISDAIDEVAPNVKAVLGSQITGKLLAIAGSLERLALVSSSTLQMLGAEKALFKAIKSGGKTPKYGILFQWNKIRSEKAHLRGKIARMVAGKISILAKVDYYKGEFIGDEYKEMIDRKIALLQKQHPRPPKREKPSYDHKPGQRRGSGKPYGKGGKSYSSNRYSKGKPSGSKGNYNRSGSSRGRSGDSRGRSGDSKGNYSRPRNTNRRD